MGLDCTAISKVKHVGRGNHGDPTDKWYEADAGYCQDNDHFQVFSYSDFAEHALKGMAMDKPADDDPIRLGVGFVGGDCYTPTDESRSMDWRAGSYGGYNQFRDSLAQLVGHRADDYWSGLNDPERKTWPFYELVNFADNEGVLGTDACRNLLEDFQNFQHHYYLAHTGSDGGYDRERYDEWIRALKLGADDGLIAFH